MHNTRERETDFEDLNTLPCRVRVVFNLFNKFQWFGERERSLAFEDLNSPPCRVRVVLAVLNLFLSLNGSGIQFRMSSAARSFNVRVAREMGGERELAAWFSYRAWVVGSQRVGWKVV